MFVITFTLLKLHYLLTVLTQMIVIPVDSFKAGPHLPIFCRFGRSGSGAKRRLEELVGEEDAALVEVPDECAKLSVVLQADELQPRLENFLRRN